MKKFLCFILSAILIFTVLVPSFAAEKKCNCGDVPVIQVRGIGETLYDGEGNEIFSLFYPTDSHLNTMRY